MANKKLKLLNWTKKFIKLCEENDIWYAADSDTLLGAKKNSGFIPWIEKIQVMMSPESYTKLTRLFPKNVIDGYFDPNYKSLKPSFIENREKWNVEQPFVEIRVIVPTTVEKIKQFRSTSKNVGRCLIKKRDNIKVAINDLFDQEFKGFYAITTRRSPVYINWIPNLTFKVIKVKFENLEISIPKEWKMILVSWYGSGFMETIAPTKVFLYPFPGKVIRKVVD